MSTAVMMFGLVGLIMMVVFVGAMLAFLTGDAIEPFNGEGQSDVNNDKGGAGPALVNVPAILSVPASQQPTGPPSELSGHPAFDEHRGPMPQPRAGADEDSFGSPGSEDLRRGRSGGIPGTVAPPAPTGLTQRSGITVCTVGVTFSSESLFSGGWCDYAIYPELEVLASEFAPRHGQSSWKAFRKVMDAALKQQSYTEHMVFLGAVLVNKQSRTDFVNEVYNMEHLTTIILQTHVHGDPELPLNESSKDRCRVLPVSAINAQSQHQDFAGAAEAAYSLRMRGDKFRLLFSSTMAVVVFVGDGESDEPMKTNDACERAFMMDLDVTCNDTLTGRQNNYDQTNKYAFATFHYGGHRYFATYESEESLADKLSMYLRTYSDGWAMFEVQRDLWKACRTNDYIRLELVALGARYNGSSFAPSHSK
ncbi:hypothetical protein HPB51_019151 [Rhipicephalus microplus]|uniref:Uncharacterized protein n=1 Tax=Rhipicephalus microplus TaxID=6941 RepID=A0A9J6DPV1_RHIMP|nr:hypothetical protein HPB51_019151 [Rhipicephalus microplus]